VEQLRNLDPRKWIASVFLLPDCDMFCRFCGSDREFATMSFDEAATLVRGLRDTHVRSVVLGGGEPFVWPHGLLDLARLVKALRFHVQVCTNGLALRIDPAVDRYILPIEAMDAARHNARRVARVDHHAVVMRRIDELCDAGKEFTISTVVGRDNVADLAAIADFLAQLRGEGAPLHAWHLYRFLPIGRAGARNAERFDLERKAYLAAVEDMKRRCPDVTIFRRSDMLRSRSVEYFWYEPEGLRIGSEVFESLSVDERVP
jgi:MoaA/NifB/PqqE/SkfB family radical SAM enzyme